MLDQKGSPLTRPTGSSRGSYRWLTPAFTTPATCSALDWKHAWKCELLTLAVEAVRLPTMNRRETLKGIGMALGGSMLSGSVLSDYIRIAGSVKKGAEWAPRIVPARHAALLPELVETIIPATDTPGAKEALVHVFVDLYVKDCYPKAQQEVFLKGLDSIDERSRKASSRPFPELSKDARVALLTAIEKESWVNNEPLERSFIKMLKNLTLLGFYSSKPGATQAAEYERSPGPFEGCIDLKPGQKGEAMGPF